MTECLHCGKPLPKMRVGVRLLPLQARIRRQPGVTARAINAIVFGGRD